MQFMHNLSERYDKFKVFRYNVKRSKDIRNDYSYTENGLTFKRGEIKYLKAIQNLHLELFRQPLYPFLVWLYRFRMRELVSVVVDENDNLIAYDLFMFQPVEKDLKVIHEIYVGVRHKYQDKGIEGLYDRHGKNKPIEELSEIEKLKIENRILKAQSKQQQMEIDFLKKLDEIERR